MTLNRDRLRWELARTRAELAETKRRLEARDEQMKTLLLQIIEMKDAVSAAGYEFKYKETTHHAATD